MRYTEPGWHASVSFHTSRGRVGKHGSLPKINMFGFFKRKQKDRESFDDFLMERSMQNPSLSLEDALNDYIRTYHLAVRASLDEPAKVTAVRTKLQILEESMISDPDLCKNDQVQAYVDVLRSNVAMFDSLSPEVLKRMKERENNRR